MRLTFSKIILLTLASLSICGQALSQKIVRTNGDKDIQINPDGSWDYVEKQKEKSDTTELFAPSPESTNPFELPTNEEEAINDEIVLLERKRAIYEKLLEAESFFSEQLERVKDNRKLLNKERKLFKRGKLKDTLVTLEEIEEELLIFEAQKTQLELRHQITKEYIRELVKTKKEITDRDLTSLEYRYDALMGEDPIPQGEQIEDKLVELKPEIPAYSFQTYESSTFIAPPSQPCDVVEKENDAGKLRKDSRPVHLFGYTHKKLESYFRDNDFMQCDAQISKVGPYYFITLHINIRSKKAKTNYGYIEKNSPIRFQLINGDKIYARNVKNSYGALQERTGHTEYITTYLIDESDLKTLSKNELDRVGLLWTTGFEDYEIFHVDFFMDQVKCFNL